MLTFILLNGAAVLVALAVVALRARALGTYRGERLRAVARGGLVFAVAWAATGGYWYARNIVHTGNPVYPAAFLAWPGATFPETTLLEYAHRYGVRRTTADALEVSPIRGARRASRLSTRRSRRPPTRICSTATGRWPSGAWARGALRLRGLLGRLLRDHDGGVLVFPAIKVGVIDASTGAMPARHR